ncbi:Uncharacterised protein [Segatella copri]|nr:Uncharacterised protein [Segatella copri]
MAFCIVIRDKLVNIDNALVRNVDLAGTLQDELCFTYLSYLLVGILFVQGNIDVVGINL